MSLAETTLLGFIAGFTIFLGLPVGRLRRVDDRLRVALAMFSVGRLALTTVGGAVSSRSRTTTRASATCSCSSC